MSEETNQSFESIARSIYRISEGIMPSCIDALKSEDSGYVSSLTEAQFYTAQQIKMHAEAMERIADAMERIATSMEEKR